VDSVQLFEKVARDLRREGVEVRFVSGWRSRGRDGPYEPEGVLSHHTASNPLSGPNPALGICTHGRSDLPGPLCQVHLARPTKLSRARKRRGVRYGSVVTIIAAGRANHAGLGGPWKWIARDNGNAESVGIEVENSGIGEKWPEDQLAVNGLVVAYLLYHLGSEAWFSGDHKDYTSRKIDRAGVSSGAFRKRVRKILRRIKREKKGR
jgi:hypothetical protein